MTTPTRSAASPVAGPGPHRRRFLPEVQGLRGLAVALVLLYHLDPALLPGGYVGVDVFFVISGFLITTLLHREATERGRVSLSGFYVRRVRRILPAATVVLIATGLAAFLLLPATRLLETAKQLVASAAYVENLYLAEQSVDYLAAETAASPLRHFWSLAVEEQFYLLWPLLFVGWSVLPARWRRPGTLLAATGAVGVVSFACSVWLTAADPAPAYYLPQTRMWELATGGVLALVLARWQPPAAARWVLGWAGLAAIATAAIGYDDTTAFPGHLAALPVLGSAAVIAAGHSTTRWSAHGLLSSRPATFAGDISYALYLWHWPLIVFALGRTGEETLSPGLAALVAGLSVLLAWGTKVVVEDPVRTGGLLRAGRAATVFAAAAVVSVTTVGAGQYTHYQRIRDVPFDPRAHVGPKAITSAHPEGDAATPIYPSPVDAADDLPSVYDDDCQASMSVVTPQHCRYGPEDGETTVALVGDSHAAHWVPAVRKVADRNGWRLSTYTKSSCGFTDTLLEEDDRPYTECREWNRAVTDELVRTVQPDLVLTSSSSGARAHHSPSRHASVQDIAEGQARLLRRLSEAGSEVAVIRDTPISQPRLPECVARNTAHPESCARPRAAALAAEDPQVRAARSDGVDAQVVDLTDRFCTLRTCQAVIGNVLVYRDSHHITAAYSRLLAPALEDRLSPPA